MEHHQTVGQLAMELAQKPLPTHDPILLAEERNKLFYEDLLKTVTNGVKGYTDEKTGKWIPPMEGDFYIDVNTKFEQVANIIHRDQFQLKYACPTPQWDQSVFKFHHKDENLEYLWTLPDKRTYYFLLENARYMKPEFKDLLNFVIMDYRGELLQFAKRLNGEKKDSPLLEK